MVKGFFLDGIDIGGDNLAVSMCVQAAFAVLANAADAEFGIRDAAVMMTQIAVHFLIIQSAI
jgi:hypothetical protein